MGPTIAHLMQHTAREHMDGPAWWGAMRPVVGVALALAVLRVVYLAFFCPYTLIEDEAQYWVWSRHLEWSYYTKGPGVAWTIFASTRVFGDAEWAVRLPAVLSSAVALIAICGLASDAFADRRVVSRTMWCAVLAPAYLAMAVMMTIDGPYVACWAVAAWAAWRALMMGHARWLVVLGLAVGVGVLYKYTMLLILPGIVAWAWMQRGKVAWQGRVALWMAIGVALMLLAFLPVVFWNQEHGWPTVRHLLGHLGVAGGDMPVTQGKGSGWHYNPLWTLTLIGTQLGLVGPVLVLAILGVIDARKARAQEPGAWHATVFLLAVALPMYIFYLLVSFTAEPEGNWPIAGSVTLIPIAGRQVVTGWDDYKRRVREWLALPKPRPWRGGFMPSPWTAHSALWAATIITGLIVGVFALRLDLFTHIPVVGRYIPIGRLTGARDMGIDADRMVRELRDETGQDVFILTGHYGRASLLSYYMPGKPDVYCASSLLPGGRTTPWDFWPELDIDNPALMGRPALVVGLSREVWQRVFDRVGEPVLLAGDHKVDKQGKPTRPALKAYGFRGFPPGGLKEAAP